MRVVSPAPGNTQQTERGIGSGRCIQKDDEWMCSLYNNSIPAFIQILHVYGSTIIMMITQQVFYVYTVHVSNEVEKKEQDGWA